MFKKLKDKITEEVKQSPLKSVQQLASAVVSPSSSSVFEPSSNDHFCIDDGDDDNQDTPKNSPAKPASGGFTTVSLQGQQSLVPEPLHSRRSSVSSVTSDSSSLFPRYEPSSVHFHVQSDLESASEIEDSAISNVQLERVSKENLFEAYRKLRLRYNKYKGRFVDLVEHYRRLEKENIKCKNILSETQDKALRRISELREQCNLEQEAKAHLEEALRSDLEEKDHLITTLNTKIELLKSGSEPEGSQEISAKSTDILSVNNDQITEQLKEKVKKLEALLLKCKMSITEKNETIDRHHKEIESLKNENAEKLSILTKDLTSAKSEIETLNSTVESLKRNEEDAALTLAENKLSVHQELETRDEQIKNLRTNIELMNKEKDDLLNKVKSLESELKAAADQGRDHESDDEKAELIQELARGKSEAVKLMQQKLITVEQSLTDKLKTKEIELEEVTKENGILKQKLFTIENKSFSSNSDVPNGSGDIVNDLIQIDCTSKLCKETLDKDKAKINALEMEILEKDKQLKSITDNHSLLIEKTELEIKELNDLKIKHSELQEINEASMKKYLDLENEMVVLKENYKKESIRNEELSKQLQLLKENVNELNTEVLHWKNLCSEKSNEIMKINDNDESLIESNKRINELEKLLSDKDSVVDSYSSKLKDLESLNDDLKLKLNKNYDIVKELQNNLNIITKDKHSLQEKIDSKNKEMDSLNDGIVKGNNVAKEREFKIVELTKEINNLKEEKATVVKKYEETLNSQDEKIETFKSEIENNYLQVKQQLDECNSKIHFFESLVNCMKTVLSGSNVPDLNLLNNNNMFHELQNDGKFIISAINDLKESTINKETTIEQLSQDLEIANKLSENFKSEILNLKNLKDKQTLSRQTIESKLNIQKIKISEIKKFQNELRSQTELLINGVRNELISINEETEKLKRNCILIESESSMKDKEKNNELENCKKRINMFEKQLQDRDNELKDYVQMKNKLDAVDGEKKILEQEKLHLENVIISLENEITSLKSTCDKLKENVNIEKDQCAEIKTELHYVLEKLHTVSAVSDQKDHEKDNELQNYKKLINKMKKQLQDKNNKLEDYAKMKNQLDTIGSEKKIFEDEKLRLENAISTLENDVTSLKSVCESLKENVESEKSRCMEIETELKNVLEKFNKESAKFDQLKNEICIKERDYKIALEAKDREVSSLIDELVIKDNKFEEELGKKDKEIDDLISKLKKSEEIQNNLSVNKDSELIRMKEESDANEKKLLNEVDVKNNRIGELEKDLNIKDNEIKELKESLNRITSDKQTLENETLVLKEETDKLKNELNTINQRIEEKGVVVNNLEKECIEMKNKLKTIASKHNNELKLIKENHDQLLSNEIIKTHNESLNELEHLKNSLSVAENKNLDLLSNFNELQVTINRLREECETLKLREIDHVKEIKNLTEKLKVYSSENNEPNNFDGNKNLKTILKENEELQLKFKDLEEKQAEKIKELIFDFNLKLSQKDEEIKSIESYNFDRKQEAEDFIVMELKQQIKDLQHELETRGDAFEQLLEEYKNEKKNSDSALDELKKQHDTQLREHDKKWRACLDRRLAETETKYKEEIDALSSEWKCERKFVSESSKEVVDKDEELECSNRLAVAAMESGVNSMELLKKQVTALTHQLDDAKQLHKREVNELQRLLVLKRHTKKASKNDDMTVEDCTEMEYLRNILYEYMMGKEPVVLAKVLSAIVKFDAEQTNKVIQKEEQKVSLLGQLGLS